MGQRRSNEITALDAATALLFHVGRQVRGASEFSRSPSAQ
jgi:hypothetical protein